MKFGFPASALKSADFQERGRVFQFGRVPIRIDILTAPSGIEFEDCYARRVESTLDGIPVPVISLRDLQTNKAASGRPKDLADLDELGKLSGSAKSKSSASKSKRRKGPR